MINKIISGGQTGADQGALDAAIHLGIKHGGWIQKGRMTENGPLPDKYNLQEMPTASYPKRIEQNIIDSDGTLILSHGKLTGGSGLTGVLAIKHDRPWLHINLNIMSPFEAALRIAIWVRKKNIEIFNVAGARASKDPEIYQKTFDILDSVCKLASMKSKETGLETEDRHIDPPRTVDEAVDRLINDVDLKEKVTLANLTPDQLDWLHLSLGNYIRGIVRMWTDDESLLESCRVRSGEKTLHPDSASQIIIEALWEKLQETHKLRVVE